MENPRKRSCFLYGITLSFSQDSSGWEGAQEVSVATSWSQQVRFEVRPGCSGLHPVDA